MPTAADPVIIAALRTPIGTAGHGLAGLTVDALAAPVLAALTSRTSFLGLPVDDVLLGNCLGPGGNVARIAALAAGLDSAVPAVTVDRQCGAGLDAILQGAARVRAGWADLVLAGGAESASTAPWRFWPPMDGGDPQRYTRAPFAPAGWPDPEMGPAADTVAALAGIDRARQDAYAARSHQRAAASLAAGVFDAEYVRVGSLGADERPRPGRTAQTLARLRPVFAPDGTVTAGNSCGVSDGAAAVVVVGEQQRSDHGLPGLRIVAAAAAGGDPALPGLGPVGAVRKVLQRSGMALADIGTVEITEAFAGQVLAVTDALGIDEDLVCPDGGAIALGHPWGASGAVLMVRLFARMVGHSPGSAPTPGTHRSGTGGRFGLATCAIGGGQGIAVLVEAVPAGG